MMLEGLAWEDLATIKKIGINAAIISTLNESQDSKPVVALVDAAQRLRPIPVCRRLS